MYIPESLDDQKGFVEDEESGYFASYPHLGKMFLLDLIVQRDIACFLLCTHSVKLCKEEFRKPIIYSNE